MATLEEAGKLVTKQLREAVDRLTDAVSEGSPDFAAVAGLADAVGEAADKIGEVYADLEQTLRRGLNGESGAEEEADEQQEEQQREAQAAAAFPAVAEALVEREQPLAAVGEPQSELQPELGQ